jgi:polyhydroxybutyrate depolymerase
MRLSSLIFLLSACGSTQPAGNVAGKHTHTLEVDGFEREVIVYVPEAAAGEAAVPVVFMLHGTSGDGEKFYAISGWKEKADEEGFIAVFPSALTYCLYEDDDGDGDFDDPGERKVTTKWAAGKLGDPTVMPLCSPADLATLNAENRALADHPIADDVAYLDAVLDLLAAEYVVDEERIYASGFSNGASMTSRLAVERADRFAAIAAAAGGLNVDPAPAARPLSFALSFGNADDKLNASLGVAELVIGPTLLGDYPEVMEVVANMLAVLELTDEHSYVEETVEGRLVGRFTFETSAVGAGNVLHLLVMEGVSHQYPNGDNHPIVIASGLWSFFAEHAL